LAVEKPTAKVCRDRSTAPSQLPQLIARRGDTVEVFCAHDLSEFEARATAITAT
jgi:hypothetical protein